MTDSVTSTTSERTAYVVEGYLPNGGNFMAYHLGKILHLDFGFKVCILTDGAPQRRAANEPAPFVYDPVFPCRTLSGAVQRLKDGDIFVCNPSYSFHNFGLKVKGFKMMYIQGFTTFNFLDRFFDHYVTVSPFVHDFIKNTYGLETHVIPPFISSDLETPDFPILPWEQRAPFSLTLSLKGDPEQQSLLLARLRQEIINLAPEVERSLPWEEAVEAARTVLPQKTLLKKLASSRYFITLSTGEGFGLKPLEAMAVGTTVMGFDGFGGRDYMQNGVNCGVRPYPDLKGLAQEIVHVVSDADYARSVAAAGPETARRYSYETFRQAWCSELKSVIPML